jgi:hypothetical protein
MARSAPRASRLAPEALAPRTEELSWSDLYKFLLH